MTDVGQCDKCHASFEYRLYHSGFSDMTYAYCGDCGRLATLDKWDPRSAVLPRMEYEAISKAAEPFLCTCPCGGSFLSGAAPRCPTCTQQLSAEAATSYIEANALGSKKGWRWQRSWTGLYCIDVALRAVKNAFK